MDLFTNYFHFKNSNSLIKIINELKFSYKNNHELLLKKINYFENELKFIKKLLTQNKDQILDVKNILNEKYNENFIFLNNIKFPNDRDNIQTLSKIYDDINKLYHILNKNFPSLSFEISLSGGAVLDIITSIIEKRQISFNDLDLLINIDYSKEYKKMSFEESINNFKLDNGLVICTNKKNPLHVDNISNTLIKNYLLDEKNYFPKKEQIDENSKYSSKYIEGILKIDEKNIFNNKLDLIFINTNPISYIEAFDFNICKNICSLNLQDNLDNEQKAKDVLSSIILYPTAIFDLLENTLTIDAYKFTEEDVKYFMNKHFIKLQKKFLNYNLVFNDSYSAFSDEDKENYINYALTIKEQAMLNKEIYTDKQNEKKNRI